MRPQFDRTERNLEIVRQTAEILASGSALSEAFERFCLMLAKFIDASVVYIATKRAEGGFIDCVYDHGESAHPHRPVQPESQTQRVLESGQPIFIRSLNELRGPVIPLMKHDDSKSAIFVPLRFGAETIGVLSVQSPVECAYSPDDLHLLETCALYVAVAVQAEVVRSENEMLQSVAARDALTGVASRRAFDQRLHDDWMRAQREDGVLSVLVLDVDWFKRFNDTYGHVAGDACLNQVAQAAQSCIVRESDLFARFGGEEFVAILYATEAAGAAVVAERILNAIRGLDIPHAESPLGRVTTSIGIAGTRALTISDPQALVKAADRALYVAKTSGRDRIHVDPLGGPTTVRQQRSVRTNIRTQSTPLLGRSGEIAGLTDALKRSRIVTVTGARGVGKTRIAVAAALRRLYAYPDGTWLVDCSTISDASFLETIALGTLGIAQRQETTPQQLLVEELAGRNLLLIFDDVRRVSDRVRWLCETIAEKAPHVTLLATGESPLEAEGEEVFELRASSPVDAISLFVDRAQAVSAEFEISDEAGQTIQRICTILRNVPLAIELTAPRVAAMALDDVLAALQEDPANATVDGAIDWSYRLLSESARRLFERLSVFPAHFTAESARDICAGGDLEPWDVPDALEEMALASLAKKFDSGDAARPLPRYSIVEQARAYGREVLRERLERTAIQWRYIRYFRALARRNAMRLERGGGEGAIDELNAELENVHGALEYSLARRVDVAAGADIVVALRRFWSDTGRLSEGRHWTDAALACDLPEGELRAEVLYAAAMIAHFDGDMVRLAKLSEELVAYHERSENAGALAKALNGLANARFRLGDPATAKALYERSLEQYRKVDNRRGVAVVLLNLGSLAAETGEGTAVAHEHFVESLALFRELGVSMQAGSALLNLAGISIQDGEYARALEYANECLIIFERLGNHSFAAASLLFIAWARLGLGELALARDALVAAHDRLRREPAIRFVVIMLETAFIYAYDSGLYESAARLLGFLEAMRAEHRLARTQTSHDLFDPRERALRHRLNSSFERIVSEGAALDLTAAEREIDAMLEGEPSMAAAES